MYKMNLLQLDTTIDKTKGNLSRVMSVGTAEHNLLYLNLVLNDVKCLIKHFRNELEV